MKKPDIINNLSNRVGCTPNESRLFLNSFQELVIEALSKGESVELHGFGKFYTRVAPGGKSYLTGDNYNSRIVPVFKASDVIKKHLNKG